ncbi:cell division cycle-associated protein 7-like [Xenia sp. Carnegie-2017]|uniref:cell division cycle-associated protein 7-like n=1 Tax=Xenia sp. Carnegie-2017 TaxID=2897299 RepID=UPI001F03EE0C|nr:cell division cycle-associated protein 7-like [Xenia sp. Carnegie-2017]
MIIIRNRYFIKIMFSSDDEFELSEYEIQRNERIQANKEMMKAIFGETLTELCMPVKKSPKWTPREKSNCTKKNKISTALRRNPKRKARSYSSESLVSVQNGNTRCKKVKPHLEVYIKGRLTEKRRIADRHNNDNVEFLKDEDFAPKSRVRATQHVVRPVSDFTEEDLLMVADAVSDKHYDSVNGTSCHQCRQKTDDLKTVCRNENCIGIRGQFCGPCLRNRYGESVKEAIMDPAWICPPCRGICNCSFCMKKRGSFCTGQLINLAREHGFNDVRTFLGD